MTDEFFEIDRSECSFDVDYQWEKFIADFRKSEELQQAFHPNDEFNGLGAISDFEDVDIGEAPLASEHINDYHAEGNPNGAEQHQDK